MSDTLRELAGARGSARIPVSRALLNRLAFEALTERDLPVRAVDIQPRAGDRFDVTITLTWPFVPALTAAFVIVQQPALPMQPVIVLRWSFLGAVGALVSRLVKSFGALPDGVRLDGDRLLLDCAVLAARSAAAPMLGYVTALELHTVDDRAIIEVELAIPE